MNIKNRLKKLETEVLPVDSTFCTCEKAVVFKVVPYEERDKVQEPGNCDQCNKPNPDPLSFTFNIGNIETEVLTPKTNYTCEEFETWQNEHVISAHMTCEEYLQQNAEVSEQ